jgi:hypothetical protein
MTAAIVGGSDTDMTWSTTAASLERPVDRVVTTRPGAGAGVAVISGAAETFSDHPGGASQSWPISPSEECC